MNVAAHFEVAVIGGGVLGTSVGYQLCRSGVKVGLFESGTVGGGGATAYSGGIVRAYDPDAALMKLSARGCFLMSNWEKLGFPGASPLTQSGMVYLLKPENAVAAHKALQTVDHDSYPVTIHENTQAHHFHGWVAEHHDGVVLHEPMGGYGNARQTALNLSLGMRSMAGDVFEHCKVSRVSQHGAHWHLSIGDRQVSCDQLVVAAGALSKNLLPTLPVRIRNISMLQLANPCQVPVIDEINEVYATPHSSGGSLVGSIQYQEVDTLADLPAYTKEHEAHTLDKLGKLTAVRIKPKPLGGFTGYDSYTESYRPVVGEQAAQSGLYVLSGASGRGYKYSLAIGESLAQAISSKFTDVVSAQSIIPLADFQHPKGMESIRELVAS